MVIGFSIVSALCAVATEVHGRNASTAAHAYIDCAIPRGGCRNARPASFGFRSMSRGLLSALLVGCYQCEAWKIAPKARGVSCEQSIARYGSMRADEEIWQRRGSDTAATPVEYEGL